MKILLSIISIFSAVPLILLVVHTIITKKKKPFTRVLFFPEEANITTLLNYISSTQSSLDVCMYTLTGQVFLEALVRAHYQGVTVRVITDNEIETSTQIVQLRRTGIQVRSSNSSFFMHHKFVVIDKRIIITGSLNWTLQGIHGNQENIIITDQEQVLKPFIEQFKSLWELYAPPTKPYL